MTRDRQYVPAMTPTLMTADELEHLPLPDKHVELVKGVLIVKEPAGERDGARRHGPKKREGGGAAGRWV